MNAETDISMYAEKAQSEWWKISRNTSYGVKFFRT